MEKIPCNLLKVNLCLIYVIKQSILLLEKNVYDVTVEGVLSMYLEDLLLYFVFLYPYLLFC